MKKIINYHKSAKDNQERGTAKDCGKIKTCATCSIENKQVSFHCFSCPLFGVRQRRKTLGR